MEARIPVSVWLKPDDDAIITQLVEAHEYVTRHALGTAAVRAGLRFLQEHPEEVVPLLFDHRSVKRMRLRNEPPKKRATKAERLARERAERDAREASAIADSCLERG